MISIGHHHHDQDDHKRGNHDDHNNDHYDDHKEDEHDDYDGMITFLVFKYIQIFSANQFAPWCFHNPEKTS